MGDDKKLSHLGEIDNWNLPMPIKSNVDHDLWALVHVVSGPVDPAALMDAYDAALKLPESETGMNAIWDMRQADLTPLGAYEDLDNLAGHYWEMAHIRGRDLRVAIVVSREVDYGLARMFQTVSNKLPKEHMVFRDMDQARSWIREAGRERPAPDEPEP